MQFQCNSLEEEIFVHFAYETTIQCKTQKKLLEATPGNVVEWRCDPIRIVVVSNEVVDKRNLKRQKRISLILEEMKNQKREEWSNQDKDRLL
jgi:hypothetical protein